VALADWWRRANPVEGHHEAERGARQIVGAARTGEADLGLIQAGIGLHLVKHRHQHLDLVAPLLAAHVL
jgi:hypothetical protein